MIWLDTETFSATPLKWGTYRYASDAEVMVATWALDDEPVQTWDRTAGRAMPPHLNHLLFETNEPITTHNAMFDRNVLRLGDMKIEIPIPRWRCNMVRAFAHSLPGGLEALGEVFALGEDVTKIKEGKKLVQLFCKPQPFKFGYKRADFKTLKEYQAAKDAAARVWPGRATRDTHPEQWQRFLEYAGQDIVAMRALDKKIPKWNYNPHVPYVPGAPLFADIDNPTELELYHLDQVINDRGIYVDTDLARAAVRAVEREKLVLRDKVQENTGYDGAFAGVESATQRDQMLMHIVEAFGITLPDLQKSTLERRLEDPNLPRELKELLALRLSSSTTSTAKYQALLNGVIGHRLSGTMQFNGAGRTRRWAHRQMQTGNLPRPTIPQAQIDAGIGHMKADCEDLVVDDVMALASSAIRGTIISPPGKKLVITDLANIEGRIGAWLAGEDWKLQAFRDYDAGTGPDLYKLAYAKAFRMNPEDVDKFQRQVGKVMELMLQYEGGVGAYLTGAATYGIDLDYLTAMAFAEVPEEVLGEARDFFQWMQEMGHSTLGLRDEVFIAMEALKRLWRAGHPAFVSLWKVLKASVIAAIEQPGNTFECRKFKIRRDGGWLRIRLPSGKYLCYPSPRTGGEAEAGVKAYGKTITYMGINQYTRKWQRLYTYGGKIFENACQALAGDVMKHNMPLIESKGYGIVLTVHDELPSEAPDTDDFTPERMATLLARVPTWAEGLPLAAAGFESYRYKKEQ